MSSDFPTSSEIAEENIRGYWRRKSMKTVYMVKAEDFCVDCKETGIGILRKTYCMVPSGKCETPDKRCEFVVMGGVRR